MLKPMNQKINQIKEYVPVNEVKDYWDHLLEIVTGIMPNIIYATLILLVGMWVVRIINRMVHRFFEKKDYDLTLESFLQSFINIALKAILFVLVITQLGVKSSSLVAVVGAAGLAVGLALQGSLANFAGGVLILVFKPFRVGDFIEAQGISGTVSEISIFTTKINTFANLTAVIPNGDLSNHTIINYNTEPTRRDNIVFGIGYSSDIKKAKDLLLEICANDIDVLKEPEPVVVVQNLGDSAVELSLRYWAHNEVFWDAHFRIIESAKLAFDKNGIEIPFPQRVVHQIKS